MRFKGERGKMLVRLLKNVAGRRRDGHNREKQPDFQSFGLIKESDRSLSNPFGPPLACPCPIERPPVFL